MAYTLYLYKEFPSKSNKTIRLEIFERDYAGSAIELDALSSTPITLTTDNTNNSVYIPVIKTFLGVNIKDTDQIDYTRLFTPDATKFKVIVKVNGTTEWAGYLTPDSFSQSLQYRSDINLIARDNLGMLSEFTYTSGNIFGTIRNLIDLSLTTIGFQANWEYRVKKVDANGTNVLDGYIPLRAYTGKTYQEVLETLLTGIGCQLRYVGGNKYAIFDIADLKGYGDTITSQDFLFIDQSGMLELIPAWKDITINQDYLLAEEIISNRLAEDDYIFSSNKLFNIRIGKQDDPIQQVLLPTYTHFGAGWGGTMSVPSPYDFVGEKPSNILLPRFNTDVITPQYIELSNIVPPYNGGLEIQFNVHNAFLVPDEALYTQGILSLTDQLPTNAVNYGGAGVRLGYSVILESGGKIYELGNTWEEIASKFDIQIRDFAIDKPVTEESEDGDIVTITSSNDVPCNITIMSLLEGGTLSLRFYGYSIYGTLYRKDFFNGIVRISDLKFVLKNDEPSGRTTTTIIDANYNLRGDISLALGEVPASKMNYFSMLGGIYQNLSPYYPPMTGFKRTEAITYHLSELVGREIAHHYKTQRKKLSGNIINSENFAAMPSFAKPFYDGEKYYALNYGSLDFRNEVMSVELIEVEDYATDDFTFIDAEIDTGGGESLGSGETEFIQWSAAGNAKRIYELDTASEAETAGSYAVIDKLGMSAAKKVPLFTLLDQKENLLPATPSDPESKFLNGNREWSLINLGSGGNSPKVYFTSLASDVSGYKVLSYEPEATTSYCTTVLTNEEELCNVFLYPLGVGVELLDAGTWEFDIYAKVSGTAGNVTMRAEVFKRTTGGVETTLFSKSSDIINNTDYEYVKFIYTSPSIPVDSTDRIGARIYGKNTIAAAITLSWALGDGDASFFVTPLAMRHSQLRGKNDEAGFQHITQGNQTFEGIKTFSGAFTDMVENRNTNLRIPKVAPTSATADEFYLYSLDSGFSGEVPSGAGSVTSVALTMPTGFSVSGSPITESGTFGVTFASGYFLPTTTQFASKADVSLIGAANGIAPLDSGGKVALQYLPSTLLKYMGVWDASTNTPTLTSPDTNRKGQVWNVSVAGTQFGIAFKLGDWLIYNDSGVAEKSDNSDDVTSVNGYTGAVTLKTSDIAEQTNLYYTDARVKTYADTLYSPLSHNHTVINGIKIGEIEDTSYRIIEATGFNLRIKSGDGLHNLSLLYGGGVTYDGYSIYHSGNSNSTSINWSVAKLTSTTLLLPQVAPTLASGEMAIYGLESGFSGEMPSGAGSVTSISMVVPTGLSVTPATITESGTFTISYASGYQMMTSTESSKLAGIEANANNYTLPTATASVLGGVKIGTNVTITDGVISVHSPVTLGTANGLSLITQELSLGLASTSTNGALSSTDWNTFNGKAAGDHNHDSIYLGITAKAADSDKLDGNDSAYFATAAQLNAANLTSGYLPYWNGNNFLDSVIKQYNGKIGVGTSGAICKFEVSAGDNVDNILGITVGDGAYGMVFGLDTTTGNGIISGRAAGVNYLGLSIGRSSGNVGIGYTNRTEKFAVNGTTYFNGNSQVVGSLTMTENINTNLRIPKVAPTSPTSGEYYFYIVE